MHDLYHQLTGLDSVYHILAQSLLLYGIGKCFRHLIVDVGIDKSATHVFERLGNVDFGNTALAFEELETTLKSIAKFFEHVVGFWGL